MLWLNGAFKSPGREIGGDAGNGGRAQYRDVDDYNSFAAACRRRRRQLSANFLKPVVCLLPVVSALLIARLIATKYSLRPNNCYP